MSLTITQQQGFYYLWIGNYILEVFSSMDRAKQRLKKVSLVLTNNDPFVL